MAIEIDVGILFSVAAAIVGAWWALARMLIVQFERRQDERFASLGSAVSEAKDDQDSVMVEIRRVEAELARCQVEAAARYMTRAEATTQHQQILDAIRALGSRIDALHGRSFGVSQQ